MRSARSATVRFSSCFSSDFFTFASVFFTFSSLCGSADDPSGDNPGGSIGIFSSKTDALVSVLEIDALLGVDGFDHPHDAVFLPNGDLAFCTCDHARNAHHSHISLADS